MGKTSLFSRVALSPGAGDKKGMSLPNPKNGGNGSMHDADTNASTHASGNAQSLNKTMRSSTVTSNFKDTIQRGVLSGAGILKPTK
jgi:hypothetical protein